MATDANNPLGYAIKKQGKGKTGFTTMYSVYGQGYSVPDSEIEKAIGKGYKKEKPTGYKAASTKTNLEKAKTALLKLTKEELKTIPDFIKSGFEKAKKELEAKEKAKEEKAAAFAAGAEERRKKAIEKTQKLLDRAAKLNAQLEKARKAAGLEG